MGPSSSHGATARREKDRADRAERAVKEAKRKQDASDKLHKQALENQKATAVLMAKQASQDTELKMMRMLAERDREALAQAKTSELQMQETLARRAEEEAKTEALRAQLAEETKRREKEIAEQQQAAAVERAAFMERLSAMSAAEQVRKLTDQKKASTQELAALRSEGALHEKELVRLNGECKESDAEIERLSAQEGDEESKLRTKFAETAMGPDVLRLVLLGVTGNGKSTFGNRLLGDKSEDGNQGKFATSGRAVSATKDIQTESAALQGHTLSVVDTPGTFDTDGEDRAHANQLVQYLKGCKGVNAFLVFKNGTDARLDHKYQGMLEDLEFLLGRGFLAHVIIIATNVEPGRARRQFDERREEFRAQILQVMKVRAGEVFPMPLIGVGLDDYEEPLTALMAAVPKARYLSESLKGPLDVLREELARLRVRRAKQGETVQGVEAILQQLDERMATVAADIASLEAELREE